MDQFSLTNSYVTETIDSPHHPRHWAVFQILHGRFRYCMDGHPMSRLAEVAWTDTRWWAVFHKSAWTDVQWAVFQKTAWTDTRWWETTWRTPMIAFRDCMDGHSMSCLLETAWTDTDEPFFRNCMNGHRLDVLRDCLNGPTMSRL